MSRDAISRPSHRNPRPGQKVACFHCYALNINGCPSPFACGFIQQSLDVGACQPQGTMPIDRQDPVVDMQQAPGSIGGVL